MTIRWTMERIAYWMDGERVEHEARVARRWRLRVLSDREAKRDGGSLKIPRPSAVDFDAIILDDLDLMVRAFGFAGPYEIGASGAGMSLDIVADVTLGLVHEVQVTIRPADETRARWSCLCGAGSRGDYPTERAQESADDHVASSHDRGRRPRDIVVDQSAAGWAQREIAVARRFRVCVRSDSSIVKVHRMGYGEEFELVIDGQLGLWARKLGAEAALRRDEDARGVSLLVLDVD